MYIQDVIMKLREKENIPIIIYMVANVVIIYVILGMMGVAASNELLLLPMSLVLFVISMCVALTPFGEELLKKKIKAKKITDIEMLNQIEPDFIEVYKKARQIDPSISEEVELLMLDGLDVNAFAVGRKTICITEGFVELSSAERKACLAHEFGHISNKDTDLVLMVTIGNFFITAMLVVIQAVFTFVQWIFKLVGLVTDGGGTVSGIATVIGTIATATAVLLSKWWTKFGAYIVLKANRLKEFDADGFAFNSGYGDGMLSFLNQNISHRQRGDLLAVLASTHPERGDRIEKLKEMGAI